MDFKSMKRKDLQALCKHHGIPGNTTNSEMIRSLSSISQIGGKVKPRGCLKGSAGSSGEELGVLRGESKKVTFVFEEEEGSDYEEFARRPGGKSKRKSVGGRRQVGKGGDKEVEESVSESVVARRSTRSRGLAEAVVWSPPVIAKKKKAGYGIEGVRSNVEGVLGGEGKGSVAEVATTRSLRNRRVVVVGGDEGLVSDKSSKRSQKSNISEKELKKDDAEGKRNLRKRSRNGDSVEERPPLRRLTRNRANLEETLATEEDDAGRSKKRRRRDVDVAIDKKVEKEVERVSKPANTAKRAGADLANSSNVLLDSVAVTEPTRRLTRSASNILEDGISLQMVKKPVKQKSRSRKQLKDSEVVAVPRRRTTRSSATLMEDGTSLPVIEKSVTEAEAVRKGKSQKQGKVFASLSNSEAIIEPVRRKTRSSATLVGDGTSLTVIEKSVKEGQTIKEGKSQKQVKVAASLPNSEVVIEPIWRRKRTSSTLVEDGIALLTEDAKQANSQKQAKGNRVVEMEDSTVSLPGNEPTRRSTRSSAKLVEGETISDSKQGHREEAVITPERRSTRSSLKSLEGVSAAQVFGKLGSDNDSDGKSNSGKQATNNALKGLEDVTPTSTVRRDKSGKKATESDRKGTASTVSSPVIGALTAPTLRSTRSSLNLSKGGTSVEVENLRDEKSVSQLDSKTITESTRRSTRSLTKGLEDASATSAVMRGKSGKKTTETAYKGSDSTAPSPVIEAVTSPTRRSTRSSLNISEGGTLVKAEKVGAEKSASLLDSQTLSESTWRPTYSSSKLNLFKSPSVQVKLGDVNESVQKKSFGKQVSLLGSRSRAMNDSTRRSEVEGVYGEVQRHITSNISEAKSENLLPIGENLADKAEIVERNEQAEELDGGLKDMMMGTEVTQVTNSLSPCKISEELAPKSAAEASPAIDLEEPDPIGKIHDANLDGSSLIPKGSEASTVFDLENRDAKREVDGEDAAIITDEMTLDTKICSEFNIEEPNSVLEVDDASKGNVEGIGNETPYHSTSILVEARDISGKALEASSEAVSEARDLFNLQRTFLYETESCKSSEDCSNVNEIKNDFIENEEDRNAGEKNENEVSPLSQNESPSFNHLCLQERAKEYGNLLCVTSLESLENAPSFIANVSSKHDGVNTEDERETATGPILPSDSPALGLFSADQLKEKKFASFPEMMLDNATTNGSHGNEKESDSMEMSVEGREACMYEVEPTVAERNLPKDNEYSSSNLAEVSSGDCKNSILSPQSSSELLKQEEVEVESLPILLPSIGSEENLPMGGTEAPAILGNEGSTEQEDIIPAIQPHTSNKEGPLAATDLDGLSCQSGDENEVAEKLELTLPCNVHEELDVQKEADEKDSAEISLLNPECLSEAEVMIPVDISECKGNTTAVSEPTIEDFDNADAVNNVDQNKNLDLNTPNADQPLVGLQRERGSCIRESTSTVVTGQADECMRILTSEHDDATRRINSSETKLDFGGFDETAGNNSRYGIDIARGAGNSVESKCRDKFENIKQTSNVAEAAEAWHEPGASTMFVDELFQMDSEVAGFANNNTQGGQWECRYSEDSFGHGECESFMEVSTNEIVSITENDICELPFRDGSLSSSSRRDSGLISLEKNLSQEMNDVHEKEEAYSTRQYKPLEQRVSIQEAPDVSKSPVDDMVTLLDGSKKIEGPVTTQARLEESTLMQEKTMPFINEAEDSESIKALFTSEEALISSKIATDTSGSTSKTQESKTSEKEILSNKKSIEDLCWSRLNALPNDTPKSAMDVNKEQNKIEDIKDCVQSTTSAGSCKPYCLIDDATKNNNTVDLKMGSSSKHTEKSTARRPLQRVRKTEDID